MKGRPKTTGRFDTREELVEKVAFLYFNTNMSIFKIARNVKVSETVAHKIIDNKEYEKTLHQKQPTPQIQNRRFSETPEGKRKLRMWLRDCVQSILR